MHFTSFHFYHSLIFCSATNCNLEWKSGPFLTITVLRCEDDGLTCWHSLITPAGGQFRYYNSKTTNYLCADVICSRESEGRRPLRSLPDICQVIRPMRQHLIFNKMTVSWFGEWFLENDFWIYAELLRLLPSEQWSVFYRQVILVVYHFKISHQRRLIAC